MRARRRAGCWCLLVSLAAPAAAEDERFRVDGFVRQIEEVTTKLSLGGGRERALGGERRFGAYRSGGEVTTTANSAPPGMATARCTSWNTQGEDTNLQGICQVSERLGAWSMTYVCNLKGTREEGGWCWGRLVGGAGRYAGRHGSATWRAAGDKLTGEGVWFDRERGGRP